MKGLSMTSIPAPNSPDIPSPIVKGPTRLLGKPFKSPKIVASPNAWVSPWRTAQNKDK